MNSGMLAQFLDYPENLLSDLGLAASTEDMHILAERSDRIIDLLHEDEYRLAEMYYKDRLSREEIAGQIGIKQEKLQYQLQKLLNKLKHPVYLNYLTDGISLLDDIKKRNEKLEEEIKELKRENLLLKEKLFSKEGKYGEFLVPKGLDTKLEDMGLSVRLNDVLVMRDYRTVRDFEGKTGKQLRDMKGMGKKSYEELREVLKLYNIFID